MDLRTAQAARDLGLFLERASDLPGARKALAEAIRIDEKVLGVTAPETLADVGDLATILPAAQAAPLLARAAESRDPAVAGPALSAWAEICKAAGDRAGAASLLRRAVTKAEAVDGKNGPMVALVLNALAAVAQPEEAIGALGRALEIDRKVLAPQNGQTLQDVRSLAGLLRRSGRATEAAALEHQFAIGASH
jgi:tetratricopeptide (TPR) repeat protein